MLYFDFHVVQHIFYFFKKFSLTYQLFTSVLHNFQKFENMPGIFFLIDIYFNSSSIREHICMIFIYII